MTCESPCIGVCRLDEAGAFCLGCLRTRSEIGAWSGFTETEKHRVIAGVEERKAAAAFPHPTPIQENR
jgi:uncharacterized protein